MMETTKIKDEIKGIRSSKEQKGSIHIENIGTLFIDLTSDTKTIIQDSIIQRSTVGHAPPPVKYPHCPQCGEEITTKKPAKFCPECGERLE